MFRDWDYPHFNMCANVELTALKSLVKERQISVTIAIVYVLSRAANEIPEFRLRIREDEVVEHAVVHPATTILVNNDQFSFCDIEYIEEFSLFSIGAAKQIASIKENPFVKDERERDNRLYMTAIPWVSFTSFMHPMNLSPADSVPRFAWGKFFSDGTGLKMPLSVQGHHALMDGLHVGRYFAKVSDYFCNPVFL